MKNRIMSIALILIVSGLIAILIIQPFQSSDLDAWRNDVSFSQYNDAVELLQDSLDNPRNTYYDFFEDAIINYNLPSHDATLTSDEDTVRLDYTGDKVAYLGTDQSATFDVTITESGYYNINTDYIVTGTILNNITLAIAIDGEYLYDDAQTIDVPLYWRDTTKDFGVDTYGDQTLPLQEKIEEWRPLRLFNNTYTTNEPLLFYFEQGPHTITIENVSSGDLRIGDVTIDAPEYIMTYEEYLAQHDEEASSTSIFINAIDYTEKNSSFVRLLAFGDPGLQPFDTVYKKLNAIDGNAWNKAGQEVTFEVTVEEDGLYDLTLHFANYKSDFEIFRSIYVNGEIPYQELMSYGIPHTPTNWDNHTFQDDEGNPYKLFLEAGTHTITIRAEQASLSRYLRDIQVMIDHINQFALEIIKITGKDIDRDRTWELTKYLPETELYLTAYNNIVKRVVVELSAFSDKDDLSATLSYLKRASVEFEKMLEDPDELPLYMNNLYSGEQSVTLFLGDSLDTLSNQQLYLNGLYISNNNEFGPARASIFKRVGSTLEGFINSYFSDKFRIENDEDAIDVWVNRPITYVDIMQKMADSSFTEDTGIEVKISVMPDANKLILANSAGNNPDVALGLLSYMPFDLAIRGALTDLSEFDDFWAYSNHFAPGAMVPYILDDGAYAIPETLEFHALVYRKDVFNALDLDVPDTWDDVVGILPTLQRYDMNFYYPTSGGTSLKWFYQTTPLIFQNGGSLYSEDGLTTTINSEESIAGLQLLGDLYTTYSLPEQVPLFYNSFRYNKLPVGIIDFNIYMQLKNAAPELVGQWEIAPYPGIYNEDTDTVERWFVGNGTGAVMFENSDDKEGSWAFMKWWMSTETQTEFAYTLQSTYGPEFLWLSGNLDAVENTPIDIDDKEIILEQVRWLRDVPRTPGQYMLERGLSDIWNSVTFDQVPVRVAIDRQVIVINREIRRKMIEFGYLDADGNSIRDYVIRDVDWIQQQQAEGLGD
jgi:ABC-type glycerol-3-phosphate transport system substrate-binding protein